MPRFIFRRLKNQEAFRVSLTFALIGFLWIFFSDKLLLILFNNSYQIIEIEIYKGSFFIITVSIILFLVVKREFQEKQHYQSVLEMEKSNYKTLFDTANDAIMILDDKSRFIDCNDKTLEMFNCNRNEFLGSSPFDFSPEFQSNSIKSYELGTEKVDLAKNNQPQKFEWIHTNFSKNKLFYTEVSLNKVRINNEEHLQAIVRDISDRKKAEEELRRSEAKYRILYQNAMVGMATIDVSRKKLRECNNKFSEIFGFDSINECLKDFKISLLNDNFGQTKEFIERFNRKGKIEKIELQTLKNNGKLIWIELSAYKNEATGHIKMIVQDITQRIEIRQRLRKSEEKYRLLVENGPLVFWVANKEGKTIYISPNIEKIYGYTPNEIYDGGKELLLDTIHEQEVGYVLKEFNDIFMLNKNLDVVFRIKTKNGNWIWLHEIGEKYIEENGEEVAIGIIKDITNVRNAHQKVLHAMINAEERERSRIAKDLHDGVSPILSALKLYVETLRHSKDENMKNELSQKISATINESIQSISEISNNISPHILQNFGLITAVESFKRKISDLNRVNLSLDTNIKNRLPENIEITFYRITTELINNSLKYSQAKNIEIKYLLENTGVIMIYTDDGVGFDTNEVNGQKKGMGILNMKNRVNALNGNFEIRSKPNEGVKVEIFITLDK